MHLRNGIARWIERRPLRFIVCASATLQLFLGSVLAQNFSGDARKIGLGGVGDTDNISSNMVAPSRSYRAIVLPFGVIQAVRNRDRFNPSNDKFDPVFALEYAASPVHYTFDRDPSGSAAAFVHDVVNGTVNRDLRTYAGFIPAKDFEAEGLISPSLGHTFKFAKDGEQRFHGFYVGVGPYLALRTVADVDQRLRDLLSSPTSPSIPNASLSITDSSIGQAALAVTGGYRARIPFPGSKREASSRDGLYFAANYHYLRGYRYDTADMRFRFDTDSAGLITLNPTTVPAAIDHNFATSGTGYALDFGGVAVIKRWQFGFGANGVGNRIDWKNIDREQFTLQSLLAGGNFVRQSLSPGISQLQVKLPVNYTGNASFDVGTISVLGDLSHGFQGTNFHGGIEERYRFLEFRGGARFSRDQWHPTGGIGWNITRRFSVDVAAFGTSTNIERKERIALAASIRLNRVTGDQPR